MASAQRPQLPYYWNMLLIVLPCSIRSLAYGASSIGLMLSWLTRGVVCCVRVGSSVVEGDARASR
jgi:hypothetical protein